MDADSLAAICAVYTALVIKAAIDVGSNSVLLVAMQQTEAGWITLHEASAVTGLGKGTKLSGLLDPEGASATLDVLQRFFDEARSHGATEILAGGTMALRIASDSQTFLERAEAQQTPVFIVSGPQEAELGFLSVCEDPLFAQESRLSIVDPGGHSTELVTADRTASGWEVKFRKSYPLGALGLRETSMPAESPGFSERLFTVDAIDTTIALEYLPHQCGRVVALGATGTNLVSIRDRLVSWQPDKVHGAVLDFEEVCRAVGWMCDMDDAGRAAIVGLEQGREKTIHIGALILERFLHCLHALECTVSVRGWRHALISHGLPAEAATLQG